MASSWGRAARTLLVLAIAGFASQAVAQGLSEAQRLERCANNRARIAELQASLPAGELAWSDEEIARAQTALRSLKHYQSYILMYRNRPDIMRYVQEGMAPVASEFGIICFPMGIACAVTYVDELNRKLLAAGEGRTRNRAVALRVAQEMQPFQTNLIALGCDRAGAGDRATAGAFASWMIGKFDTSFGLMTLSPGGGSYAGEKGTIQVSSVNGATMKGTWVEPSSARRCEDGSYSGRFSFNFNASGFSGSWGYCDGPLNLSWSGTRQ